MFAVIWTYWIGVVLVIPSILAIVGIVVGYIIKVKRLEYPRDN